MTNSLTLPEIADRAKEQSVKDIPNNPPERSPDTLNLLVPWDIPLACQLSEPIKQQIEASLRSLLQALNTPNLSTAHHQIHQLLSTLPAPKTQPAQVNTTKTALSTTDVEDYDTYFHITHVQPAPTQTSSDEATALILTQGLLTNCYKFTTLCLTTPTLSSQHITQQKQGFISYLLLLTRTFNIQNFPQ
ncbi:MAG: hypothetical protein AAFV85_18520 [Cyanobacteria bacterium J06634_6]